MQESLSHSLAPTRLSKQLILVLAQRVVGARLIDAIRHETPFQAILATNLQEMRRILSFFSCDYLLLADDAFPDEDLDRLYLLPEEVTPPMLFGLAPLLEGGHLSEMHVERVFKALQRTRSTSDPEEGTACRRKPSP